MNYDTFPPPAADLSEKRSERIKDSPPSFADDATFNEVIGQAPWGWMHWKLLLFMFFAELCISSMFEMVPLTIGLLAKDFELSKPMMSLPGGLLLIGGLSGTVLGAYGCDMYGRKSCMLIATTFAIIIGVMQVTVPGEAQFYWAFCVCRILLGLSFGAMLCAAKPYFTEFLAIANRGRNLNIISLGWGAGTFYCISIAWAIHDDWRIRMICSTIPLTLLELMLLWPGLLPESPRWLYVNGREQEGRQVVHDLWSGKLDCSKLTLGYDAKEAKEQLGSWKSRLRQTLSPRFCQTTLICAACYACVSGGAYGVNTWKVFFIAPDAKELPILALFILEASGLITLIPFLIYVDIIGRRPMLIAGSIGSAACMFAAAVVTEVIVDSHSHLIWMTVCISILQATTVLIWCSLVTTVMEAFPTYCRGTAFGIANSSIRISGAFFSFIMGFIIEISAAYALIMVGIIFTICTVCSFFLNVETANMPIEDFVDARHSVKKLSLKSGTERVDDMEKDEKEKLIIHAQSALPVVDTNGGTVMDGSLQGRDTTNSYITLA